MAHPVNGIEYLLNEWDSLRRYRQFPFYAFLLFTDQDREFASFFQEYLVKLDEWSGNACMFFAIAPPPQNWLALAGQREYWKHFLANTQNRVGYDNDAVKQAARYFSVPSEHLPAIVLFRDISHNDVLSVRLGDLGSDALPVFFNNLFRLLHIEGVNRWPMWQLRRSIDLLPHNRLLDEPHIRRLAEILTERQSEQHRSQLLRSENLADHDIAYRIESPLQIREILEGLQTEMRRLSQEVQHLREEQRDGFREVQVRLERIQVVLEETIVRIEQFRRPFIARWLTVEANANSLAEARDARAELHAEFDTFLEAQSHHLAERLYEFVPQELPESLRAFADNLEETSRVELTTAEMLWTHLSNAQFSFPIDFSVAGIGLWKALEIELNRTFVDALRVSNHICTPGRSSLRQASAISGRVSEDGIFNSRVDAIHLTRQRDGCLIGVELGKIGGLLAYSRANGLSALIASLTIPPYSPSPHDFIEQLSNEVRTVADTYRNSYAHIQPMPRAACNDFRNFLLNAARPHSPLFATLHCKKHFLRNSNI